MSFTMRELEILAALRPRWTTLYFNELSRLLRQLDGPYLFCPRARPWRRARGCARLRWQRRRHRTTMRHTRMR
jgi:hypothetical protein